MDFAKRHWLLLAIAAVAVIVYAAAQKKIVAAKAWLDFMGDGADAATVAAPMSFLNPAAWFAAWRLAKKYK